jgi:hypothetical protein
LLKNLKRKLKEHYETCDPCDVSFLSSALQSVANQKREQHERTKKHQRAVLLAKANRSLKPVRLSRRFLDVLFGYSARPLADVIADLDCGIASQPDSLRASEEEDEEKSAEEEVWEEEFFVDSDYEDTEESFGDEVYPSLRKADYEQDLTYEESASLIVGDDIIGIVVL